jgi:hypothetical protein
MPDKESLSYQNLKPLLNNATFKVKLKRYDFVCGSLKVNTNYENITLGPFVLMDEDNNTFKDMKQNNDKNKHATSAWPQRQAMHQSQHKSVVV